MYIWLLQFAFGRKSEEILKGFYKTDSLLKLLYLNSDGWYQRLELYRKFTSHCK